MLVQTFRFMCRKCYVRILLHLSITHVILLQFQQVLYLWDAEFPDNFRDVSNVIIRWVVEELGLFDCAPLFAQDFAVLLGF
jgi:hypothetical protein